MEYARWIVMLVALIVPLTTSQNTAPSPNPKAWWPTSGAIILCGGGLQTETANIFVERLIALAGGPDAQIVIIPTASDELPAELPTSGPQPKRINDLRQHFESRGARRIAFLHTRDRPVANSEAFVKILKSASGVFFPGGRSRILDETYHDTLVARELQALLKRGGVVAGDSAGAITMGCFWLGWTSPTSDFGKITDGLCLLPQVTVTPHAQRLEKEWTDTIFKYVAAHPPTVGINIEENTALVIKGSAVEVIGQGAVAILDSTKDKKKPPLRLTAGQRHDFAK